MDNEPDSVIDVEVIPESPTKSFLNSKQSKFVASYQLTGNATEAAINAGYSAKSAHIEGHRLLKHPKILAELRQWKAKKATMLSKDSFIDKAMERFERLDDTEPNSPRFLDIAGKALGYIGNNSDSRPNITNNIQLNKIEVNALPTGKKWDALRSMLEQE